MIRYISTRGGTAPMTFREAVMTGLARDGGLLLPDRIPQVAGRLDAWRRLSYPDLAVEVMRPFVDLEEHTLRSIITTAYAGFRHPEIAPVVRVGDIRILELFHGPTLAFKDIALQLLGGLFDCILAERGTRLNILAATSGDTGSAAIHGVRGRRRMRIFVMHPRGRISPTQERQMTTVLDDNVFNMALEGTFDDCQRIMKTLFGDVEFKQAYALGAVNSINWARLLAQVVYYVYATLRVTGETGAERVCFAVPTGNFGDILAGYLAVRMGLPVSRLILATNENDILARFFATGDYSVGEVRNTVSPSMDIQVASNFERYLYYRLNGDTAALAGMMADFRATGRLRLPDKACETPETVIHAGRADTGSTLSTMREFYLRHGYVLDPHTAVGVHVAQSAGPHDDPVICLATAHPAKFADAVRRATGADVAHHPAIDRLGGLPTRCDTLPADAGAVRQYVVDHAS